MKKGYILSIILDAGGSEVLIFDQDGHVCSRARADLLLHRARGGRLEHDSEEIYSSAMHAIAEALTLGGIAPAEVKVIGVTNENDSMVLWERRTGMPLGPAIVRQGDHDFSQWDDIKARRMQNLVRRTTGVAIDPYRFAGTKLRCLLDAQPGMQARAASGEIACGSADSWLVYRLTGGREHITDRSNALRTSLYDAVVRRWNRELLALLDIPPATLPEVRPLSECYGETGRHAFFGVQGIPVVGIAEHHKEILFG